MTQYTMRPLRRACEGEPMTHAQNNVTALTVAEPEERAALEMETGPWLGSAGKVSE